MSYSEDKFKEHIKQVTRFQATDDDRPLTLDELKELALDMGMTESEWSALLIRAEDVLNQAIGHMRVQNYTDAISCAEEATSINPYIKDGNAILAQCYLKLALVDKNQELFVKAEHFARMELKNDPMDSVALNVLSAAEAQKQETRDSSKNLKLIGYIGGGVLLIFLVLFMCSKSGNHSATNSTVITSTNSVATLYGEVNGAKSVYHNAIKRRNDLCFSFVPSVQKGSLQSRFQEAIEEYDFDDIDGSEKAVLLAIGEVKSAGLLTKEDITNLDGAANRIAVEKNRYLKKAEEYNAAIKANPSDAKGYEPIEINE